MVVRVINNSIQATPLKSEFLISTVEKNRDRIRNISSMILTICGFLVSASTALVVFMSDKRTELKLTVIALMGATVFLVVASVLSSPQLALQTARSADPRAQRHVAVALRPAQL